MYENSIAIAFNGPPGSGKDFAVEHLQNIFSQESTHHLRFKDKLYELTKLIYHFEESDSEEFLTLVTDRKLKDLGSPRFNGLSPREALIHVSEDIIKPNFGNDYFGNALVSKAKSIIEERNKKGKTFNLFLISDSGFISEFEPLCKQIPTALIRIHRDGHDFSGDSRKYIYPTHQYEPLNPIAEFDLQNDGNENFEKELVRIVFQLISNRLDSFSTHL